MKITLSKAGYLTYQILAEDGQDRLIQTDWDLPGLATTFGWDIKTVPTPEAKKFGDWLCLHESTDGTVDCEECGQKVSTFIEAAQDWLDENIGAEVDDPGYFEGGE